jgi:hypothetical protein
MPVTFIFLSPPASVRDIGRTSLWSHQDSNDPVAYLLHSQAHFVPNPHLYDLPPFSFEIRIELSNNSTTRRFNIRYTWPNSSKVSRGGEKLSISPTVYSRLLLDVIQDQGFRLHTPELL